MAKARSRKHNTGWGPWPWILGLILLGIVGLLAMQALAGRPPAGTESFTEEGNKHVPSAQRVTYATDPPTSGMHWDGTVKRGFHDQAPAPELLVHNLEHGNVIIYYDPVRLPKPDQDKLKRVAQQFTGEWDGVVAVPRDDAEYPLILTAWQARLRLQTWDQAKVDKFVDAYRGRGPEQRVR